MAALIVHAIGIMLHIALQDQIARKLHVFSASVPYVTFPGFVGVILGVFFFFALVAGASSALVFIRLRKNTIKE